MESKIKRQRQKPVSIEASYTQTIKFDIEDYDIELDQIEWAYVRWCTLYIKLKNGGEIEIDHYHEYDTDWKRPDKAFIYDSGGNELDQII